MTAQVSDTVRYRDLGFSLAGINGEGLFEPAAHGLAPVAISSACWRGYYCTYAVEDGRLLLETVHLGLNAEDRARAERGNGPLLYGTRPRYDEPQWSFAYGGLHAPVAFTGGLLGGREFIQNLYVHMGFHPAWKYRQVHELLFEQGQLREAFDRSGVLEDFRGQIGPEDLEPHQWRDREQLRAWIKRTFSLRYEAHW
jgi:hypothetical protein